MNKEISISFTATELFYLKDIVHKAYWKAKDDGEDEDILKIILSLGDKIHSKRMELVKNKKEN